MFRSLLAVTLLAVPVIASAQLNTTGSLATNETVAQGTTRGTTTGTTGTLSGTAGTLPGTTTGTTGTTGTTTGTAGATGTTAGSTTTGAIVAAPRDAAIVTCAEDISTGANRLVVSSLSVSAGGPAIAPMAACAQALADLFAAGYGIIDVQQVTQQVQYTLVR